MLLENKGDGTSTSRVCNGRYSEVTKKSQATHVTHIVEAPQQ